MEPRDKNGAGDDQRPAKKATRKRTPTARKRSPKTVQAAEQNGGGTSEVERDAAVTQQGDGQSPGAELATADRASAERATANVSTAGESMGDQPAAHGDTGGDGGYSGRDAERAAESAADELKSWMDTRPEDRDGSREVL